MIALAILVWAFIKLDGKDLVEFLVGFAVGDFILWRFF